MNLYSKIYTLFGISSVLLLSSANNVLAEKIRNYNDYKKFCYQENYNYIINNSECKDNKSRYLKILQKAVSSQKGNTIREFKSVRVSDWRSPDRKIPWSEPIVVESDFEKYLAIFDKNYQKSGDGIFIELYENGIISKWTTEQLSIFVYSKQGCDAILGCRQKNISSVGNSVEVLVDDSKFKIYGENGNFSIPGDLMLALERASEETHITLRINDSIISDIGDKTSRNLGILFSMEGETNKSNIVIEEKLPVVEALAENNSVQQIVRKTIPGVVKIETSEGVGTGFVISNTGLILTNRHVVSGNKNVSVNLYDGSKYEARVLKKDRMADIAVIKIENLKSTMNPLPLCYAQYPNVGEDVIAIGNPLSLNFTVTRGIVSGFRQTENQSLIQTDTPINPGNSGGPLLNQYGEVIGIINAKKVAMGIEGLGFAIPILETLNNLGIKVNHSINKPLNFCGNPVASDS